MACDFLYSLLRQLKEVIMIFSDKLQKDKCFDASVSKNY